MERSWRQMLQYSTPVVDMVEKGYSTVSFPAVAHCRGSSANGPL
jgi:hypothetical protein